MASNDVTCVYKSESLRKMVYPRVFSSPVIHDNIIYVVGGCDQMGQPVDSFEMYDISKKKWTTLPSMKVKRAAPAVGEGCFVSWWNQHSAKTTNVHVNHF